MQTLIISGKAMNNHRYYSTFIKQILEYIVTGNVFYLPNDEKSDNDKTKKIRFKEIKLTDDEIYYFSELLNLYNNINFLLAETKDLPILIKKERDIWINPPLNWKKRPKEIDEILNRIFGYKKGFSRGLFIHLHKDNKGKYTIQYSQNPPPPKNDQEKKEFEKWNTIEFEKWGATEFLKSLNVNFCVYCNEQSLFWYDNNHHSAFDHFYSQSDYPFLALTLTNLIPSCNYCNSSIKGSEELSENAFNPYEGSFHKSVYFHLLSSSEKEHIKEDVMKGEFSELLERKYSINTLKYENTEEFNKKIEDAKRNGEKLPSNPCENIRFFKIVERYKKFDYILNEKIDQIYGYFVLKYRNNSNCNLLTDFSKNTFIEEISKKILDRLINRPEFSRDEEDINKYQFCKLTIDLCKECEDLFLSN